MSDTLSNQANKAMIEAVKKDKPSSFTVGVAADVLAKNADVTLSYDRKITNAFGLTAYLKAWYHDAAVIPSDKHGALVGLDGTYKF
jgi:hypothetical protein